MDSDLTGQIETEIPRLLRELDAVTAPAAVEAVRAEALAPFSESGPWRYAPASEKAAAAAKVDAELAQRSGEALFRLEHQTEAFKRQLQPLLAQVQEPPSVETVYRTQSQQPGIAREHLAQLEIIDELRRQRFAVELGALQPSQLLARYETALAAGPDQEAGSLIRVVEGRHRDGWTGIDVGNDVAEGEAKGHLKARIAAARAARIPALLTACQMAIEAAERQAGTVKTLRRVRAVRPVGWQVA
jgi:hypothetical protein